MRVIVSKYMENTTANVPQDGFNCFDHPIASIAKIVQNKQVYNYLKLALTGQFNKAGLSKEIVEEAVVKCLDLAKTTTNILEFERNAHATLMTAGIFAEYTKMADVNAKLLFEKVKPYLVGKSVLDLGCGTGKVAELISKHDYLVTLADVYKNDYIKQRLAELPFLLIEQGRSLPFADCAFDNALLFVMLHHATNPVLVLEEVGRALLPSGRLHIIETVFGVDEVEEDDYSELTGDFIGLSHEEQRLATMFLDYFGNRVGWYFTTESSCLVPVPFNFNKPAGWRNIFSKLGYKIIQEEFLGVDPNKGVCHVFFVLEKG